MLFAQDQLFLHEEAQLAPYALRSRLSRGRKYPDSEDLFRTPFQRDRDRIVHSKAFRRLCGKTQVFIAGYGDHYRSRLTHSLEVSAVSRDIARAFGLNEDLCETIALAHDLGHTPFGHAGEEAMNEMMLKFGKSFEHNEQSLRVVSVLEKKSDDFPGLNLTFETLEGLMKHRPMVHSLEAQVADLSDRIAYHHHDLDDGLRSGILEERSLQESIPLWQQVTEELSMSKLGFELYRATAINRLMNLLIDDVLRASEENLKHGKMLVTFSSAMQEKADALADYLGGNFYLHEKVSRFSHRGKETVRFLFELYSKNDRLLPLAVRKQLEFEERPVVIKDYIAGMTDRFALKKMSTQIS